MGTIRSIHVKDSVHRHTRKRLALAWKCGVLGLVYSCALDWDHIWVWLLEVAPPINITGIQGRPFHHPVVFLLYAVVVSVGVVAFVLRRHVIDSS